MEFEGGIDEAVPRPRFRRFDFARAERRLDLPRLVLAGIAVVGVAVAMIYLGSHALRGAMRWVHRQPQYQVRFSDILLREPPPPWFRGGAESFLKQVRELAKESEVLPVLDLETGRIERAFKLFPWVEHVERVEYPPQSIVVDLAYNVPVAIIVYGRGDQDILDSRGHLLPAEDIDTERIGPLIKITGDRDKPLLAPVDRRPGLVWNSNAPGADGTRLDRAVLSAAKLAGLLLETPRSKESITLPALRILEIRATDPRGIFLYNAEGTWVLWGAAPGEEPAGRPDTQEKWEILRKWASQAGGRSEQGLMFWYFTRTELKPAFKQSGTQ